MSKTQYLIYSGSISDNNSKHLTTLCSDAISKGFTEIYIAISSTGGSVPAGIALFNTLRALPVTVTMHNIGAIDSTAVVVFLAGQNRYATEESRFMIHAATIKTDKPSLNQCDLAELTKTIHNDQENISKLIAKSTTISQETLKNWFFVAEIITPTKAIELEIISEIRKLTIPTDGSIITVPTQ